MTPVKPQFPKGASKWWAKPVLELTPVQLAQKRKHGRMYRAFKRATDPQFKELDRLAYHRCIDANRPKAYARNAAWRKANWQQVLESRRKPNYRIASILRSRICKALKAQKAIKSASLLELLGCELDKLRAHIASKFRKGMTWENYGPVWHVDHERPCSLFDLSDEVQQRACFHFSNLQPLFAGDNLRKGASA